jgi:ABC-type uncharacterized transport system substrate-binding protein
MRRRQFIALLGGAVAACSASWPHAALAQSPAMPVIGLLNSGSADSPVGQLGTFHRGLRETGYVEDQNVKIEYRWVNDRYDRLPDLAAELVRRPVTLPMATGGPAVALAAKAATSTIPIVFTAVADPVRSGLVASLNRPGGNITGTAGLTSELDPKRLELLHQLVSTSTTLGALVNPNRPGVAAQTQDVEAAARTIGRRLLVVSAGAALDIDAHCCPVKSRTNSIVCRFRFPRMWSPFRKVPGASAFSRRG